MPFGLELQEGAYILWAAISKRKYILSTGISRRNIYSLG